MKTVDDLIGEFKIFGFDNLDKNIPTRDVKILKNISNLMSKSQYITENQATLILKILKENHHLLGTFKQDVSDILHNPTWATNFRLIEKIKKVYIGYDRNNGPCINLEATFDKTIKKILSNLNKIISYDYYDHDSKIYSYSLEEKNILTIYEILNTYEFNFSNDFLELYNKISQIDLDLVREKFNFKNFYIDSLKLKIVDINIDNPLHILDKKIKYQYFYDYKFDESIKNTLQYKIANRSQPKVFIDRSIVNFSNLYTSLNILNRNKILIIFERLFIIETLSNLQLIYQNLYNFGNDKKIGVYFRFTNRNEGKEFNFFINEKNLNSRLDDDTDMAILSNGKIPKFVLTNNWYPDAVISFTKFLRNNKTDLYCSKCDLVIYYLDTKPLSIKLDEIM